MRLMSPNPEQFVVGRMKGELSMTPVPFVLRPQRLGKGEGYVDGPWPAARSFMLLGWFITGLGSLMALAVFSMLPWHGWGEVAVAAFGVFATAIGIVTSKDAARARQVRRVLVREEQGLAVMTTAPSKVLARAAAPFSECVLERHPVRLKGTMQQGPHLPLGRVYALIVWVAGEPFAVAAARRREDIDAVELPGWLRSIDRGDGPEVAAGGDLRIG